MDLFQNKKMKNNQRNHFTRKEKRNGKREKTQKQSLESKKKRNKKIRNNISLERLKQNHLH